jgi:hypothetical protein
MTELPERDMLILQLAKKHPRPAGALEIEANALLGHQCDVWARVNQLIDTEAALAHDSLTVNRLRRVGNARRQRRLTRLTARDDPSVAVREDSSRPHYSGSGLGLAFVPSSRSLAIAILARPAKGGPAASQPTSGRPG